MTALVNIVVIIAVMVLVVQRQMRAQRLDTERRFWLLPLILGALALRDPQLIDHQHTALSATLVGCGLVAVVAMGSVWGWTVRLWRAGDGSVWAKGTKATVAAWVGMLAIRLALYGVGAALHVHQAGSALLLGLAVLLLTRSFVVNWRARALDLPQQAAVPR
ncbi:CcdC protein domain-containing protein [Kitasatospora sp. NPDC058397]|uniref:CcdC protein domain-containing protein n=1 Tax=unclassified Kitasatospora TaxID=2633591 RepID=UPI00365DFC15